MIVCEFCLHHTKDGKCTIGLRIPKGMSCREFSPGIEKFCSDPKDFVNPRQIIQMAMFFEFKSSELRKIKLMATKEEATRLQPASPLPVALAPPD